MGIVHRALRVAPGQIFVHAQRVNKPRDPERQEQDKHNDGKREMVRTKIGPAANGAGALPNPRPARSTCRISPARPFPSAFFLQYNSGTLLSFQRTTAIISSMNRKYTAAAPPIMAKPVRLILRAR